MNKQVIVFYLNFLVFYEKLSTFIDELKIIIAYIGCSFFYYHQIKDRFQDLLKIIESSKFKKQDSVHEYSCQLYSKINH